MLHLSSTYLSDLTHTPTNTQVLEAQVYLKTVCPSKTLQTNKRLPLGLKLYKGQ